jgi:hypothetical protein
MGDQTPPKRQDTSLLELRCRQGVVAMTDQDKAAEVTESEIAYALEIAGTAIRAVLRARTR